MKENQLKRDSILSIAQGAIEEKVDFDIQIGGWVAVASPPKAQKGSEQYDP